MTTDNYVSVTCDLAEGGTVAFDIPHSEADDYDDTHLAYEILQSAAGA